MYDILVGALAAVLTLACSNSPPPWPVRDVRVAVAAATVVATTDPRFLSFAVDTAQVVGARFWSPDVDAGTAPVPPFDFSRQRLAVLTRELAPAYLRVGGTDADRVFYDLGESPATAAPAPFQHLLTRTTWAGVAQFARDLDTPLLFTLAAGPGTRDADGGWTGSNARTLVQYAAERGDPVAAWELGNEPNAFPLLLGGQAAVSGAQYAADVSVARAMLSSEDPAAWLAAPACAFWPVVGEFNPVFPSFMDAGGGRSLDIISWHYYPQQSRRCPVAVRPATPETMLSEQNLDEIARWASEIEAARDASAPGRRIWLGETGNAQCGGEPGVSDRFAGSFWWLDQLGLLARRGHEVVVRQTLAGSEYGLLDDTTLEPRPDYWASVLWKRLMGERVLAASVTAATAADGGMPRLRAYAHCAANHAGTRGGVSLLLLNLDAQQGARVRVDGVGGSRALVYAVTADGLGATAVRLGGRPLVAAADGSLPALDGAEAGREILLAPLSYAFALLSDAGAEVCR
jgi:heparanase 1